MASVEAEIRKMIESKLEQGYKNFIIFPFGEVGYKVKQILNIIYGIQEVFICDNHLNKYNESILSVRQIAKTSLCEDTCVLLASTNYEIYRELKESIASIFSENQIAELECMCGEKVLQTVCGKYTFGSLKNHPLVESVGAFCSFADGTDVVSNHAMDYITTHPMLYKGNSAEPLDIVKYNAYKGYDWFFPDVEPHGYRKKFRRVKIGNDVWLGKNVIITNGAYIGNGVIAGAGSIITKNIPDYAIVVGSPARIIRYRYEPESIKALNRIAWWDWTDDKIRERFEDFYLPVQEFIKKYDIDYKQ